MPTPSTASVTTVLRTAALPAFTTSHRDTPATDSATTTTAIRGWLADERATYGAFFWINGDGAWPIPRDSYSMNGVGGQWVWIIPSHDLVIVRLGNFRGQAKARPSLAQAMEILMEAVP